MWWRTKAVGDAGGAVRQYASDHSAAFAAIPEALGVGLGRRIGRHQLSDRSRSIPSVFTRRRPMTRHCSAT